MCRKVATKGSNGATTSNKCNFPLLRTVAADSSSSVKGAILRPQSRALCGAVCALSIAIVIY